MNLNPVFDRDYLHVVHVVRDLDHQNGGLSQAVGCLAGSLVKLNVHNSIVFGDGGFRLISLDPAVRTVRVPPGSLANYAGRQSMLKTKLTELHHQQPISLFHLHGLWDGLTTLTARYAARRNVPYVCSPHGMLEPWSLQQHRLRKRLAWLSYQHRTLKRAVGLHATAAMESDNIAKIVPNSHRRVIPLGLNSVPQTDDSVRRLLPKVALFLSRIHPKKGLNLLIQAWESVRPEGWICQIVGPGDPVYIASLNRLIQNKGLQHCVSIQPPLDDVQKWTAFERASLFVLPTFSENFGIVVAEALATGVPVITTTETPWTNLGELGCGWTIRPNADELAATLRHATSRSADELDAMGAAGRTFVSKQFTWDAIAAQFKQYYLDALSPAPSRFPASAA